MPVIRKHRKEEMFNFCHKKPTKKDIKTFIGYADMEILEWKKFKKDLKEKLESFKK